MRRGSTPTFCLRLPAKASLFPTVTVLFAQDGKEILTLDRSRLSEKGAEVFFSLTEEETLSFRPAMPAELQLRLVDREGAVWVSGIRPVTVRKKYPEDLI
jgi:hypothetical protein